MKTLAISVLFFALAGSGIAAAKDLCSVPEAEWQTKEALQAKLESEGWSVKSIKVDDGCYEAYGKDAAGNKMEVYFDPKTFEVLLSK